MKDRKLKYVYNFVGSNMQTVESSKEVATGRLILGASFVREGEAMPATGTPASPEDRPRGRAG